MRLPLIFSRYVGRHFLFTILLTALALAGVALLIDAVELMRRGSEKAVPLGMVLQMALLKSPNMLERLLPFAVLVGSLLSLSRLTRSQELIVARGAGVSVWQFLTPALVVSALLGVAGMMLINPLSAATLLKFEKIEGKYITGKPSLLSISPTGLWLRQVEAQGPDAERIIHALRVSQSDMVFSEVMVLNFDEGGRFRERLDASTAQLQKGQLLLSGVLRSMPGKPQEKLPAVALPTSLEMENIQDSFARPETIPFWKLPGFIMMLEDAGFSALRHRLYLHSLLASPFLFVGMVLIAALFSLRLPRLGRVGQLTVGGLVVGFFLHFFTNIVSALGMSGSLPIVLAAWAPACIILMLGAATLLHLEDG